MDTRNLTDILFALAYDRINLGGAKLRAINIILYGFVGKYVQARGMVSLPITFREDPLIMTHMVDFLVVDQSLAYSTIIGQLTLNTIQAMVLIYHLVMKFLIRSTAVGVT